MKRLLENWVLRRLGPRRGSVRGRALLAYTTIPFFSPRIRHSNFLEARTIADTLCSMGYKVTVVDFRNSRIEVDTWDVVIGFGDALERRIQMCPGRRAIYYATGAPAGFQNQMTAKRLEQFEAAYKQTFPESARFRVLDVTEQESSVDQIIMVGNRYNLGRYRELNPSAKIACVNPPYICADSFLRQEMRRSYQGRDKFRLIWFAGSGLIHKGFDILAQAVDSIPRVHVDVIGDYKRERKTVDCVLRKMRNPDKMKFHGHVAMNSRKLYALMSRAWFHVLPSVCEGQATSVTQSIIYGGLIPVVTEECGHEVDGYGFLMREVSIPALVEMLETAWCLSNSELQDRSRSLRNLYRNSHAPSTYRNSIEDSLRAALGVGS